MVISWYWYGFNNGFVGLYNLWILVSLCGSLDCLLILVDMLLNLGVCQYYLIS